MKGAIAFVIGLCAAAARGQWSDDFNRPDGAIGGDWTPLAGTWTIEGNRGRHTNTASNEVLRHNSASMGYEGSTSTLDVFSGTASQYSAVVIGWSGTGGMQVKVQDQLTAAPGFSHIGIYHFTGSIWTSWTGGTSTLPDGSVSTSGFMTMPAGYEFLAARMTVWFPDPDTVQLDLDTDFDGDVDQSYTRTGVLGVAGTFGMQAGIACWQSTATFDNWSFGVGGPACYPDCEDDGDLDLFDYLCFQGEFANQTAYADCEEDGDWDIFDFLCYQGAYVFGCN